MVYMSTCVLQWYKNWSTEVIQDNSSPGVVQGYTNTVVT